MSAAKLYTPQLLALAVDLADFPPMETFPLHGEARAPTCGSTLALDLALDNAGVIVGLGMRVRACAVGQAAASLFARAAKGRDLADIVAAHEDITDWLSGQTEQADPSQLWPGLAMLAPAREFPARHGAILNPWKAALRALSSPGGAS